MDVALTWRGEEGWAAGTVMSLENEQENKQGRNMRENRNKAGFSVPYIGASGWWEHGCATVIYVRQTKG